MNALRLCLKSADHKMNLSSAERSYDDAHHFYNIREIRTEKVKDLLGWHTLMDRKVCWKL